MNPEGLEHSHEHPNDKYIIADVNDGVLFDGVSANTIAHYLNLDTDAVDNSESFWTMSNDNFSLTLTEHYDGKESLSYGSIEYDGFSPDGARHFVAFEGITHVVLEPFSRRTVLFSREDAKHLHALSVSADGTTNFISRAKRYAAEQ